MPRWLVALATLLLWACATQDDYRAYRRAHPGWEARFPKEEMSLAELLAVVHKPPGRNTSSVITHLRVMGLGGDPWQEIPLAAIRDGSFVPEPGRLYLLAARGECLWTRYNSSAGVGRRTQRSFVWYVLRDGRLLAWKHSEFGERCGRWDDLEGTLFRVEGFEDRVWELLTEGPEDADGG